jgi:hypothetical protein
MENERLRIPDDPTGIEEAHDVLAAEDFAMPSGPDQHPHEVRRRGTRGPLLALGAAAVAALALAARRRR